MCTSDIPKLYSSEDDKVTIDYFKGVFEDKLKLYDYCECQLSRVAFVNSIFIAAIALLINKEMMGNVWVVVLFLPFLLSLTITLWYTIPKFFHFRLSYGDADHRSIYGIAKFKSVKAYKDYISKLKAEETYSEIITQIYNINDTIIRDYRAITVAVMCDIVGLLIFTHFLFKVGNISKLFSC